MSGMQRCSFEELRPIAKPDQYVLAQPFRYSYVRGTGVDNKIIKSHCKRKIYEDAKVVFDKIPPNRSTSSKYGKHVKIIHFADKRFPLLHRISMARDICIRHLTSELSTLEKDDISGGVFCIKYI
jgi:hypothetical protein